MAKRWYKSTVSLESDGMYAWCCAEEAEDLVLLVPSDPPPTGHKAWHRLSLSEAREAGADKATLLRARRVQKLAYAAARGKETASKARTKRETKRSARKSRASHDNVIPLFPEAESSESLDKKPTVTASQAEKRWKAGFEEAFPAVPFVPWKMKELGQVKRLIKEAGGPETCLALDYLLTNWYGVARRYFKNTSGYPSLGLLVKCRSTLIPEAHQWGEWLRVEKQWLDQKDKTGSRLSLRDVRQGQTGQSPLQREYTKLRASMVELGVVELAR